MNRKRGPAIFVKAREARVPWARGQFGGGPEEPVSPPDPTSSPGKAELTMPARFEQRTTGSSNLLCRRTEAPCPHRLGGQTEAASTLEQSLHRRWEASSEAAETTEAAAQGARTGAGLGRGPGGARSRSVSGRPVFFRGFPRKDWPAAQPVSGGPPRRRSISGRGRS